MITATASSIGSAAQTLEVSASRPNLSSIGVVAPLQHTGYNSIYATGTCSSGEVTERSNGLSVYYYYNRPIETGPSPPLGDSLAIDVTPIEGTTRALIIWTDVSMDEPFEYQAIAVASGKSCDDMPVSMKTVDSSASPLKATLKNLSPSTRYDIFVRTVSKADPKRIKCSSANSMQTWPFVFLPRFFDKDSPLVRCEVEEKRIRRCISVKMGGYMIANAAAVAPLSVGGSPKILVGGNLGGYSALARCDLNSDLDTVSNCQTSKTQTTLTGGRVGGILVYKSQTKVLLTESDADNTVYACDLDMTSSTVITNCEQTGKKKEGPSLVLAGYQPDGIARKGATTTVYVSAQIKKGGIWTCTLNENATSNADALVYCTFKSLGQLVFELYYDNVSEILWGTRTFEQNEQALVSCPKGITANCKDGIITGLTVSSGSEAVISGRGYVFWSPNQKVYTGKVDSNDQVESLVEVNTPEITSSDGAAWYPPI